MASDGVLIYDSADKTPPKPQLARPPQRTAFDPRPLLAVLAAGIGLALLTIPVGFGLDRWWFASAYDIDPVAWFVRVLVWCFMAAPLVGAGTALALIVRNYRAEWRTKEVVPTLSGMPMTLEALAEMNRRQLDPADVQAWAVLQGLYQAASIAEMTKAQVPQQLSTFSGQRLADVQQPVALLAEAGSLSQADWLAKVNRQPDKTPHLAVTGPSGSGKTTLVLAVLSDRPGRFVIATPKAERTDPWGGFPAVRLDLQTASYAPLARAVKDVYAEMLRRNALNVETDDDWLTLAIDDYSTVAAEVPEVKPLVLRMTTLGRSARICLVLIDTETNVRAWGIEGRGESRQNFLYIECEEDTHKAVIYRWGKTPQAMETSGVYELSRSARLADRAWQRPVASEKPGLPTNWEKLNETQRIVWLAKHTTLGTREIREMVQAKQNRVVAVVGVVRGRQKATAVG